MTGPERLSEALRRLWRFMTIVSAVCSLGYTLVDDAAAAISCALAGLAFYAMSFWHDVRFR